MVGSRSKNSNGAIHLQSTDIPLVAVEILEDMCNIVFPSAGGMGPNVAEQA